MSKFLKGTSQSLLCLAIGLNLFSKHTYADDAFSSDSRWMTGDWGGARHELMESGYDLTINYTNEIGYNAKGGSNPDRKVTYADETLLGLGIDLEKTLNIEKASLQFYITNRNGEDITNQRLIDTRSGQVTSTQEVWGRGSIWRLAEFSYRQQLFEDRLNLRLGRFGLGEFGEFPCDFQNLLFCGNTGGSSTGTVWYNFPVSQWGLQASYQATAELMLQTAVFEQNPSLQENDNGFKTSFSGGKGLMIPAELVYKPKHALLGLPAELRVGAFLSTAEANDVYYGDNGQAEPLDSGAGYKTHESSYGYWMVLRQRLAHIDSDANRPVELFTQAHFNRKDTSYIKSSLNLGITAKGLFDARPADEIGFALGRVEISPQFAKRQRLINQLNGETDFDSPDFIPIQSKEYSAEAYYGIQATKWLMVRPNVQYIRHPGAVSDVDDAWVIGLKIQTKL